MVKIEQDITPANLRCAIGCCPSVYKLSDGDLVVIGKKLDRDLLKEIEGRVAEDELAVKISPDFFEDLPKKS